MMDREPLGEYSKAVLPAPDINWDTMNNYRMDRIRQAMAERDVDLAVITNPLTMRYAVNYHEYMQFQARIPLMMLMIFADGPDSAAA
ncbi:MULTISPECIES: aminopeptidase P family N-terminal domain-containing protein [unclassified Ruegeria]|uniref:aminopeptidase P family N-terminal domain-containing protein n=1 Tax=unclassified Ruegeria TaxID=2625375 RepID=UPI001487CA30|nr:MULTISPECIES: aminopeptidase P family N-terminal domain-containing protein [unclassified Ruegeria]NOD77648.1 hypothetical protein [Ruegeria sp. HKCCD4332]NOD89854.1 hypothetical protein [Ruegeria sp. HKCCD4318]NOE14700.1 hypothetical protein [Ruegeria sp. HKCCD4318-2]NOG10946.1 hypothetical protein [Ruegeria sp. HKCCD4315]